MRRMRRRNTKSTAAATKTPTMMPTSVARVRESARDPQSGARATTRTVAATAKRSVTVSRATEAEEAAEVAGTDVKSAQDMAEIPAAMAVKNLPDMV